MDVHRPQCVCLILLTPQLDTDLNDRSPRIHIDRLYIDRSPLQTQTKIELLSFIQPHTQTNPIKPIIGINCPQAPIRILVPIANIL